MTNIYQKLYNASQNASTVKKGEKKTGMNFNPLLHDVVQEVAMAALREQGLYPTTSYKTETHDEYVLVTCYMTIHDVTDPTQSIKIDGCSAMGGLDKFGTGQAMSYSRKYAFLNALNLRTGIQDEDGMNATPFKNKKNPQANSGVRHGSYTNHASKDVHQIMNEIKECKNIYELREVQKKNQPYLNAALKSKSPAQYVDLTDLIENKQDELMNRRANG